MSPDKRLVRANADKMLSRLYWNVAAFTGGIPPPRKASLAMESLPWLGTTDAAMVAFRLHNVYLRWRFAGIPKSAGVVTTLSTNHLEPKIYSKSRWSKLRVHSCMTMSGSRCKTQWHQTKQGNEDSCNQPCPPPMLLHATQVVPAISIWSTPPASLVVCPPELEPGVGPPRLLAEAVCVGGEVGHNRWCRWQKHSWHMSKSTCCKAPLTVLTYFSPNLLICAALCVGSS